jgi:hypothetical protein
VSWLAVCWRASYWVITSIPFFFLFRSTVDLTCKLGT